MTGLENRGEIEELEALLERARDIEKLLTSRTRESSEESRGIARGASVA